MWNKELRFKNQDELVDWLLQLFNETEQRFEKEFNVKIELFTDDEYQRINRSAHNVFIVITRVVNTIEKYHTNDGFLLLKHRDPLIWHSQTFQFFAKEIIGVSEYIKRTKHSQRPESKIHKARKSLILKSPAECWNNPTIRFKKTLYWVASKTGIVAPFRTSSSQKEREFKKWWIAVQCLMLDGLKKTAAQIEVQEHVAKANFRKQYNKVNSSNWAEGAGIIESELTYHALKSTGEVNIDSIFKILD